MSGYIHAGGDPAAVTNGNSDVHILGRLKFKSLSQLHNMATPFTLSLDHKNRRFIVICLQSSSEIVALISNWDTETGIINDPVAIDTVDSVPMDTTKDVAIEPPKKPKKGRAKRKSTGGGVGERRKSVRLEARRIAASEEDSIKEQTKESAEIMVPTEGTTRFMSELREPMKWRKLGKLPVVSLILYVYVSQFTVLISEQLTLHYCRFSILW